MFATGSGGADVAAVASLERYRRHLLAQGYAPGTVREKVGAVQRVAANVGADPARLTVDDVLAYLARRPLAAWSRRKYLEHLRAWSAWAQLPDPTAGLRVPNKPRGVPKPLGEQELAALLAEAREPLRTWLILGAFAGLRSFEVAQVRGDDLAVGPDGPTLRVRGKAGRVDVLPAAFVVVRALEPWRREMGDGRLWPAATAAAVQHRVRQLGHSIGVQVSSHRLRHRYGTQLYAASRDLLLVQQLMRHASVNTTAGYVQVGEQAAARLVDQLPLPATRPRPAPDPRAADGSARPASRSDSAGR